MSNIQKYGSFTDAIFERTNEQIDSIAGGNFLVLEQGDNVVRFLPAPVGKESPFRVTAVHYVDKIPGLPDKMFVFACPRHELREQCPMCLKCEELARSPVPDDRERAKRWSAGLRVYANVVSRNKPSLGVKLLIFGKMIWDDLKKIRKNPRLGGDFTDPGPGGFDIIINREGTERSTRYTTNPDRQSSPLAHSEAEIDAIMANAFDLDAQVDPIPAEELLAALGIPLRQRAAASAAFQSAAFQAGGTGMGFQPQQLPAPAHGGVGASVMQTIRAPGGVPAAQPAMPPIYAAVPTQGQPVLPQKNAVEQAMDDDFNDNFD